MAGGIMWKGSMLQWKVHSPMIKAMSGSPKQMLDKWTLTPEQIKELEAYIGGTSFSTNTYPSWYNQPGPTPEPEATQEKMNVLLDEWDTKTPTMPTCVCDIQELAAFGCPSAKGNACRTRAK
jgi:hypothetical protein